MFWTLLAAISGYQDGVTGIGPVAAGTEVATGVP